MARMAGAACAALLVAIALLAVSAGGKNRSYTVRAIFDDAGNLISGEDVKIDGVKVGTVGPVTPTPTAKAAVQLKITNKGFQNFRADASCEIRPQALIGEKYVDCLPTQPRVEGTPLPPPLHKIERGEGSGQYLLPVTNTHSPVDIDLLGDISRLPERQRLTIILNEFGAGLAGRGSDLNAVIKRANPALQELDRVLAILAGENHTLAKLAVDSDQALKPLAAVREHVADFIVQGNKVTQASAATRGSLARNLQLLPTFLEQLGPSMERLQKFAEETTPTFANLQKAAPGINEIFTGLPAFSKSSTKFYENLGSTAEKSGPALTATKPLLGQLKKLGGAALPFSTNFSSLFESLRETGGLERILDFIFLGAGSANGYDSLGHFLRTEGVGTLCLTYAIQVEGKCNGRLFNSGSSSSATAASVPDKTSTSAVMARTLAVLQGATPAQALAKYPSSATSAAELKNLGAVANSAQPVGGSTGGTTYYSPAGESSEAGGMLLNYLLGSE
jgi:phospholipid/cholesterol/gamma-HCH transport system substrate-binding protein